MTLTAHNTTTRVVPICSALFEGTPTISNNTTAETCQRVPSAALILQRQGGLDGEMVPSDGDMGFQELGGAAAVNVFQYLSMSFNVFILEAPWLKHPT